MKDDATVIARPATDCQAWLADADWVAGVLAGSGFTVDSLGPARFRLADSNGEGQLSLVTSTAAEQESPTVSLEWMDGDGSARVRLVFEERADGCCSVVMQPSDAGGVARPLVQRIANALIQGLEAGEEPSAPVSPTDPLIWLVAFGVLLLALLLSI